MADIDSVAFARVVRENLEQASPDLLRGMVEMFANALMSAEADAVRGAVRAGQRGAGEPA